MVKEVQASGSAPTPDDPLPDPRGLQAKVMPPTENTAGRLTEIM